MKTNLTTKLFVVGVLSVLIAAFAYATTGPKITIRSDSGPGLAGSVNWSPDVNNPAGTPGIESKDSLNAGTLLADVKLKKKKAKKKIEPCTQRPHPKQKVKKAKKKAL